MFENFRLDLSGVNESEYRLTEIAVKSDYKHGRGWTWDEKARFEDELYPKLEQAGFRIESGKRDYDCSSLLLFGSPWFSLRMHPMEFTGTAKPEEAETVLEILNSCECVYGAELRKQAKCYELTDPAYKRLIYKNAKGIAAEMQKAREQGSLFTASSAAFAFAENCRLPRMTGGGMDVISASDPDVEAVEAIGLTVSALGLPAGYFREGKSARTDGFER